MAFKRRTDSNLRLDDNYNIIEAQDNKENSLDMHDSTESDLVVFDKNNSKEITKTHNSIKTIYESLSTQLKAKLKILKNNDWGCYTCKQDYNSSVSIQEISKRYKVFKNLVQHLKQMVHKIDGHYHISNDVNKMAYELNNMLSRIGKLVF